MIVNPFEDTKGNDRTFIEYALILVAEIVFLAIPWVVGVAAIIRWLIR